MKTIGLVITIVALSYYSIYAQADSEEKKGSGKLYALAGIQYNEFGNINKILKDNAFPQIGKFNSYYGYGACWIQNKWVFGGEGYHLSNDNDNDEETPSNENIQFSCSGGLGYLYIGYSIIETDNFYFTPRIGAGGGGMKVQINQNAQTTLENLFTENHSNNLEIDAALIHSAVEIGFMLSYHWDFNFNIGYNHGISSSWKLANGTLRESVKDKIGGAFAQLTIGYIF